MFKLILFFIISANLMASPFLVSDPVQKGSSAPTSYIVVLNGTTYTSVPEDLGTQVGLKFDLAGKFIAGLNTVTVKAKNIYGESLVTPPFSFTATLPATPTGLKIVE